MIVDEVWDEFWEDGRDMEQILQYDGVDYIIKFLFTDIYKINEFYSTILNKIEEKTNWNYRSG